MVIVDDDVSVQTSTRRLLRSCGFRAEAFGSGDEFLASAEIAHTACLILDVCMPGMDGLEVQRCLAERALQFPIVFLTAQASDEEERRAREAGALEILRKPASKEQLLHVLQRALQGPQSEGGGNGNG